MLTIRHLFYPFLSFRARNEFLPELKFSDLGVAFLGFGRPRSTRYESSGDRGRLLGRHSTSIGSFNHAHAWEDQSGLTLVVTTSFEAHHHRHPIDITITISKTQLSIKLVDLKGCGTLRSGTVRTLVAVRTRISSRRGTHARA
ncbi:hypothetical protein CRG98_029680 [Punica granatum]|uniref:Uncharacterized protein n=1 Tax=Punica granatum TaxID=22663 RepID=A0A2I0J122_PUNGR|nr:hypothetical protein CRG98_029680 [Punica granatum]